MIWHVDSELTPLVDFHVERGQAILTHTQPENVNVFVTKQGGLLLCGAEAWHAQLAVPDGCAM